MRRPGRRQGAGFARLVLVTLDATYQALVDADDSAGLRTLATPAATAAADLVDERIAQYAGAGGLGGRRSAPVHDPLTVAYLVAPEVVDLVPAQVAVETESRLTYGRSVIDLHGVTGLAPNAHVALTADAARYIEVLRDTLGRPMA